MAKRTFQASSSYSAFPVDNVWNPHLFPEMKRPASALITKWKNIVAGIVAGFSVLLLNGTVRPSPAPLENYAIDPTSVRQSKMALADGTQVTHLQFLAVDGPAAVASDRQKAGVSLVYDSASQLTWWTWGGGDSNWLQDVDAGWVISKSLTGDALVGFFLNSSGMFGVRVSSMKAESLAKAQSLALGLLGEVQNTRLPPQSWDTRIALDDLAWFRKIDLGQAADPVFFRDRGELGCGLSLPSGRETVCKILSVAPRPHG